MGVGSNTLGYAYDEVDNAARSAIDSSGMCIRENIQER